MIKHHFTGIISNGQKGDISNLVIGSIIYIVTTVTF